MLKNFLIFGQEPEMFNGFYNNEVNIVKKSF